MKKQVLFQLLFLILTVTSYAQVTTSNIRGLVVDDQKEPLFGANIVAVHTPTGTKYGSITNEDGRFNLLNLRVGGPYILEITYVGFKTYTLNDVYLSLGQTFNVDTQLTSESQSLDEVTVVSDRSGTFNSDRTGAETNVGRRELTRLPTITRSAQDFTRLEPTASGNSFGGRNDQFNNFSLDGAIFNNPFGLDAATPGGQTDSQPISLDAIDQIQVSTAPYDVTQSGFTGASVNAVTKSGSNEFHGTAYGFFRNEDMTGGKVKGEDVVKPKLEQNQYGVSIGGPIIKNKLFFFANFEKDDRTDLGTNGWVPNTGSGAINESRVLESDLIAVRDQLLAVGYDPGAYEGFVHKAESTKGLLKLDWNIDDNNRLAVIYNFLNASKEKPAHPTAIQFRGPSANTLQFQNSGYEINNELKSVQIELNSTLSETATNKLQVGYTHFNDYRNPFSTPAPSINISKDGSNYIIAGHEPFSANNRLDQKVFQVTNNLNFYKGDHTYTVGFSLEKFMFDNSFNLTAYGFDLFGSVDIADFDATTYDFAGPLSTFNANNSVPDGEGWALAETNVGQLAFYVQDEWNLSEKFKLTYGVRFDKPLFYDSAEKAQDVIDRAFVIADQPYQNPNTGETVFIDNTQMPTNDWLISPRVGFNYDVYGDRSLQLRGGSGLFTGRFPFVWLGNQIAAPDVFFLQAVDPEYKFPQVWRTNIGADKRLDNGLVLTADVSYTKDINGPHVQNWALTSPSGNLSGVDTRAIYTDADLLNSFGLGAGPYVFTNSNKGRIWNASLKAEKTFDNGLYTMVAYSYLDAKDVNSIEAEITSDAFVGNPVVNDANADVLAPSKYGDKHRFIGVASKNWTYGNDKWGTTISTFFEYAQGGRFNYTYGGDINGDGSGINDLIYVPTPAEIDQMQFSAAGQGAAFNNYIEQDDYLSGRRGQYAERYGALAPWRGRWDLKILQDYKFNVSATKTNTIQFSIDVLNIGNMISSEWGLVQQPNNIQPVGVSVDSDTNVPTYTFNPDLTETFGYDASLLSRWQAQFGLRYIF
ncbi:carboxypeptidase regulatory-like domain-containing protein [Maribacter sp. MAR_2009_72]|uniref:TonB-dependent receptor n=1 Tax=Maribacter sp. MAR_2009_72 TaxID=1250050 RepID=UPI00119AE147|nr:carboxypeptidase regulatory-like domain-containing protein [Maribacter sp. MAR_2009_72]TVZ14500.1 outer membrane receptor protein involved in Fe transport [Maribacter sp. MAR_2009_72]